MNIDPPGHDGGMISVENWAEIRRLSRTEGVPIKAIARRLGVARNTVRAALASDDPPRYVRKPAGSALDRFEAEIRRLLDVDALMPATVIARNIGWTGSLTVLKDRLRLIRPEYKGVDPVDKVVYQPGGVSQWDLWFPDVAIPVGFGQERRLPVLAATSAYSRTRASVMIPSRMAGDILCGMWELILRAGKVTRTIVWDREAGIGGSGRPTIEAASFVGALSAELKLAPPRDPEFKGMVERNNRFLETSFLPGRSFGSPADFNTQMTDWWSTVGNRQRVRSIHARPIDLWADDLAAMIPLPATSPVVGLRNRTRLARDYHVRLDCNDYSVDPRAIGRWVDVEADLATVTIRLDGKIAGQHPRCWAKEQTVTDVKHLELARYLRVEYWAAQRAREQPRHHGDGTRVQLRALTDYDQLFQVNFDKTG